MERIQKYLAHAGLASRRAIEKMIEDREILIDGKHAKLGDKISGTEKIHVKGRVFNVKKEEPILLAFHKPRGVISTMADENREKSSDKTLADYSYGCDGARLYPIGRLDKESRGLLLMTNNGTLANKLTHPRYEHEKQYIVTVDKPISENILQKLSSGTLILDGKDKTPVAKASCSKVNENTFSITLTEGRNHQIRRMCDKVARTVIDLKRIRIANIHLNGLPSGATKKLDQSTLEI